MVEYKKNCDETYEKQVDSTHHYAEFLYSKRMLDKANLSFNSGFEKESIDDYFTALQLLSNSILLKRFKIRSKKSVCGYYKLYQEKLIEVNDYENLEKIRVKRNLVHYDSYQSSFLSDDEVIKILQIAKEVFNKLIKIYEV